MACCALSLLGAIEAPTPEAPMVVPLGYEIASATIHANGSSEVLIPQNGIGFADKHNGVYESTLCVGGSEELREELVRRALLKNSTHA